MSNGPQRLQPNGGWSFWEIPLTLLCVAAVGATYFLLLPRCVIPRSVADRLQCKNNLKQLGLALHNYHDEYGSFPPAFVTDEKGNRLYSWRVLLLPYVDSPNQLYSRLRLDEAWDSPHNRPLVDVDLSVFQCPSDAGRGTTKGATSYLAVIGPETIWPAPGVARLDEVTDGTSRTIALVEVVNSGIHWAEPRDLHVIQMTPAINSLHGQGIASEHEGGAHILFVDGSARFQSEKLPRETLRAMSTRAGGETINGEESSP